jgi:hypothetical protein
MQTWQRDDDTPACGTLSGLKGIQHRHEKTPIADL